MILLEFIFLLSFVCYTQAFLASHSWHRPNCIESHRKGGFSRRFRILDAINVIENTGTSLESESIMSSATASIPSKNQVYHLVKCPECSVVYVNNPKLSPGVGVLCSCCEQEFVVRRITHRKFDPTREVIRPVDEKAILEYRKIKAVFTSRYSIKLPKTRLYVGGLLESFTDQDLSDLFADYGLLSCRLSKTTEGLSRRFGFVDIFAPEEAERAIKEMNGFYLNERFRLKFNSEMRQAKYEAGQKNETGGEIR